MPNRIRFWMICAAACLMLCGVQALGQSKVVYTVDPSSVVHTVDAKIYGQFLEHIFNSVHGGLWGDMILNGGFVINPGQVSWYLKDDYVTQSHGAPWIHTAFGGPDWTDFEVTLDVMPEIGLEGFEVGVRTKGQNQGYYLNVGDAGNTRLIIKKLNDSAWPEYISEETSKDKPKIVEYGRWYKVRVRVEGAHLQMWVDDNKLFDFTDPKNVVASGGIGLGQFNTVVRFKNIKVTSLDGKTLWEGLPKPEDLSVEPPYWKPYGKDGYCTFDKDDSPSGNGSTVITCTKDGMHYSLTQGPLNIVEGETYKGRIYMKSSDSASVDVKILPSNRSMGLVWHSVYGGFFKNVGADWKAYDFEFKAGKTDVNADAFIMVNGKGTVKVSNFTLFSKSALDCGGFRPDLLKAIKDIKPATIRYPGGCFASGYNWKDAIGPREKHKYYPGVIWGDQDPNQMGTDEFMLLCEKVGAEPIIAVNKRRGVQDALDWMEYCNGTITSKWGKLRAENGHAKPYNVKYWEIDNEVWGMQPEDYAKEVKLFSEALKAKDPNVIVIACGSYAYDTGVGQGDKKEWNKRLLDNAAQYFDYLSIHYYNGICVDQDYVQDPRKYEAFMRDDVAGLIKNSKNPKIKIYCSEWGMMNAEWSSGLYTGAILNAFERISDVCPMTCPAVWLQRISADRPNARWASSQILYDHKQFVAAPEYVVEKLWRDNFGPNLVKLDGPAEPLNAVATTSADKKTLYFKVVNPSKDVRDVELKLANGVAKSAAFTVVNPGEVTAKNTLDNPSRVKTEAGKVELTDDTLRFNVPGLSAGIVRVRID